MNVHLINFAVYAEVIVVSGLLEILFSYYFSVEKKILDPDIIWRMQNVQQMSSYRNLLGRTSMLQMHTVPCALEIWLLPCPLGTMSIPSPGSWSLLRAHSTLLAAEQARVSQMKGFGANREEQHS